MLENLENQTVNVQQPISTKGTSGAEVVTWNTTIANMPCRVIDASAEWKVYYLQRQMNITHQIFTNQAPTVQSGWQSRWNPSSTTSPTPPTILGSSMFAWYRADQGTYQDTAMTTQAVNDGDPVGAWQDLTGNNNTVLQASSMARPTLKLNIVNGNPVVRFGNYVYLQSATFAVTRPQPITMVVVCYPTSTSTANVIDGITSTNRAYLQSRGATFWAIGSTSAYLGPPETLNTWAVVNGYLNGSNSLLHVNGGMDYAGTIPTSTLTGLTIGQQYNIQGNYFTQDIAEIILASGIVTTTQRAQLDTYCQGEYGIGTSSSSVSTGTRTLRVIGILDRAGTGGKVLQIDLQELFGG